MGGKSKMTSAPAPMEIPTQQPRPIPPHGLGTWFPTPPMQSSMSSAQWWHAGHQQLGLAGFLPQGSSWMVPPSGSSQHPFVSSQHVAENDDDSSEVQAWYVSSITHESFSVILNKKNFSVTFNLLSLLCPMHSLLINLLGFHEFLLEFFTMPSEYFLALVGLYVMVFFTRFFGKTGNMY
jgi:hypothetical protein